MLIRSIFIGAILIIAGMAPVFGQPVNNIQRASLSQADTDRILRKTLEHEREFRDALTGYVFFRSATISIIGLGGQITGTYRRDSNMALTPEGKRIERISYFPVATTPPGFVTTEDLEDLGGVNPFALEPSMFDQYNFTFVGKEKIDELNLYVFDVSPKVMPDAKKTKLRYFTGRIWIDDADLMIVKTKGKAVPETKENKFPVVETWRENVDGKYWFPSFASSDDELVFDNGAVVKLRFRVKFKDYAVGHTDVQVLDDETVVEPEPTPSPTPKKP